MSEASEILGKDDVLHLGKEVFMKHVHSRQVDY